MNKALINYHVKNSIRKLKLKAGFSASLLRNRPEGRILLYHGIDQTGSTRFNTRFIAQQMLDNQFSYFKQHFHVIPLENYFVGERDPERLTLALSFDDGYRNNLSYVLPLLEKYQFPATFFITGISQEKEPVLWADLLDLGSAEINTELEIEGEIFKKKRGEYYSRKSGKRLKNLCKEKGKGFIVELQKALESKGYSFKKEKALEDYWKQMDLKMIRELAASSYASIGSHGWWHTNLGNIPYGDALRELQDSKVFLEEAGQQPVTSLAYPDGSYSRKLVEAAAAMGYSQQLAVDYLFKEDAADPRIENRFGVNPFIGLENQLACLLAGNYFV